MSEISAAAVKSLRDQTGLPMMECKRALQETAGDEAAAVDLLRKQGKKTMAARSGRDTSAGRIAVWADLDQGAAAIVELQCESTPVAGNEEFIRLANDLAQGLAKAKGVSTVEALLKVKSPSQPSRTLGEQLEDITNRMREVVRVARIERIDGRATGYAHHTGSPGVLVEITGGHADAARDVAMHVAAMRPKVVAKEDLDPALVNKEREILAAAARQEGKPENIIPKMIEGRLRNFYAEAVLNEQPFIKDEKKTVGKLAEEAKMKVLRFVRWELSAEPAEGG